MGIIITFNRRTVFFLTFIIVFVAWASLHNLLTGSNKFDGLEFIVLICGAVGSAIFVSRRFPPIGKRL